MKIQTFSVLAGSAACNAHCPYCVAKMTPHQGVNLALPKVNWRNFDIGCRFARDNGVSTVLLTGKGEPTLFPEQITDFLKHLWPHKFPFIEMQTNGIKFFQEEKRYTEYLKKWHRLGMTFIAISIVHYKNEINKQNFQPNGKYMDLIGLISHLHKLGFSVRLSCVMLRGAIDSVEEVENLIGFAKKNKVEELTFTPMRAPEESENAEVAKWVFDHGIDDDGRLKIKTFLSVKGKRLLPLMHGAMIYDVNGQNVCLSDCLTSNLSPEEIRQLIFFPDGHLRYDWRYPGAILL